LNVRVVFSEDSMKIIACSQAQYPPNRKYFTPVKKIVAILLSEGGKIIYI
jgi:hypothetical protein